MTRTFKTVPLPVAAAELGVAPSALVEAAAAGNLTLCFWQSGRAFFGVLFGDDVEVFVPAEEVDELEPPYALPAGLVTLEAHQLDRLRSGCVQIRDAGDAGSGFKVQLAEPVVLTFDNVLISSEEWRRYKGGAAEVSKPPRSERPPKATTAGRQWIMRPGGWRIEFDGRSAVVGDLKGMRHIAELLRVPRKLISVQDLVSHEAPPVADDTPAERPEPRKRRRRRVLQEGDDEKRRRTYLARRQELAELISATVDPDIRARLKNQQALVGQTLRELGEAIADPALDDLYRKVRRRMREAWKVADKSIPGLAEYLSKRLKTGHKCYFQPHTDEEPWFVTIE